MSHSSGKYPHIQFKKTWKLKEFTIFQLGQCDAIIKAISNTPIRPDYREHLHAVALIKGAQATTAIEGNTLTYEQIQEIQKGKKVSPSKEYLQIEVQNILDALNGILKDLVINNKIIIINPELIQNFHRLVGKDLGEHFKAIPGKFRNNNVTVGNYLAPDFHDVHELTDQLCDWLRNEFHFGKEQTFVEAIIQAIVTHVYIAWIHPFSDGNGRTARLLEFYLLLRAGVPDIASHVLSNHYSLTRSEYYRQIENATNKKELTEFIDYAVEGFGDGLFETLNIIQENQLQITWRNYIYGIFENKKTVGKASSANKRRRNLILRIPFDKYLNEKEIIELHSTIIRDYSRMSDRTLSRDIEELVNLNVLDKNSEGYRAKVEVLGKYMAVRLSH
ncbi:MAG: Fic family protein [Spirochaetota bacterium]